MTMKTMTTQAIYFNVNFVGFFVQLLIGFSLDCCVSGVNVVAEAFPAHSYGGLRSLCAEENMIVPQKYGSSIPFWALLRQA